MIEIAASASFHRAYRKRVRGNSELEARFARVLAQFADNPYEPRLRTHKLSGDWRTFGVSPWLMTAVSCFALQLRGASFFWILGRMMRFTESPSRLNFRAFLLSDA
jgi:hypothetical protein